MLLSNLSVVMDSNGSLNIFGLEAHSSLLIRVEIEYSLKLKYLYKVILCKGGVYYVDDLVTVSLMEIDVFLQILHVRNLSALGILLASVENAKHLDSRHPYAVHDDVNRVGNVLTGGRPHGHAGKRKALGGDVQY